MSNVPDNNPKPVHGGEIALEQKPISPRLTLFAVGLLLLAAILLAGFGILRRTRAEAVALPVEHGCTEWTSQDPTLGAVTGLFAITGDAILSTFASADGQHKGGEVLLQLGADRYLRRGFVAKGALRVAAWSLELVRAK